MRRQRKTRQTLPLPNMQRACAKWGWILPHRRAIISTDTVGRALRFPGEASTSTVLLYAMEADAPTKRSRIVGWSTDERLRERLLARGQEALTADEDAAERGELDQRGRYTDTWTVDRLEGVVQASLARIQATEATESMRQKFLQALGTLRRRTSENVRYVPNPKSYTMITTLARNSDSVSAAELRAHKTIFITDQSRDAMDDEQLEFYDEATEEGSGFKVVRVSNRHDFKTPLSAVIADSENERKFIRSLLETTNLAHYDGWIKSTPTRFYEIDYAWKKRNAPKRGKFSPDFFLKLGDHISVVEIKGDEELAEASEENIEKNEYALAHFDKLNEYLAAEGSLVRDLFNFLSPASLNAFFQALRDGKLAGFRSELDVRLSEVG